MSSELIRVPKGLEGVLVDTSSISLSDPEGFLLYRGYNYSDFAEKASFEEIAYLILYGELPSRSDLAQFSDNLKKARKLPEALVAALPYIAKKGKLVDWLNPAITLLGCLDPKAEDLSREANLAKATSLIGAFPVILSEGYRISAGLPKVEPRDDLGHAANALYMLLGKEPEPLASKALNTTMVAYADHDFNASTFTVRVAASTLTDLYSAVAAGIAAWKGPLHGGAAHGAMVVLKEIGSPERAKSWVDEKLARKIRIQGFGHRVYKKLDPRVPFMKKQLRQIAERAGDLTLSRICETVEEYMWQAKQLPANTDFYSAPLFYLLGLPVEANAALLAMSRVTGWCAHYIEQVENNRLIRPRAEYVGAKGRNYTPIEQRH